MTYPIEAEKPIVEAFEDAARSNWINVTPTAIASTALTALEVAGWGIVYPKDFPGLCGRCRRPIMPGTRHEPFNGNQMFACTAVTIEPGD